MKLSSLCVECVECVEEEDEVRVKCGREGLILGDCAEAK